MLDKAYDPYEIQKRNAKRRGIPFLLSRAEWISIWEKSGKFKNRGRGKGKYVMSRKGDKGAYVIGNVEIILHGENLTQALTGKPSRNKDKRWDAEKRQHMSELKSGKFLSEEHIQAIKTGAKRRWAEQRRTK
jgi:hypothetical protein